MGKGWQRCSTEGGLGAAGLDAGLRGVWGVGHLDFALPGTEKFGVLPAMDHAILVGMRPCHRV